MCSNKKFSLKFPGLLVLPELLVTFQVGLLVFMNSVCLVNMNPGPFQKEHIILILLF